MGAKTIVKGFCVLTMDAQVSGYRVNRKLALLHGSDNLYMPVEA
jgi:hypothetical protein